MIDPRELLPQGDAETKVFLPGGEVLLGLYIKGVRSPSMLGVRVDELGRPLSCAWGVALDEGQSNPVRHPFRDRWGSDA